MSNDQQDHEQRPKVSVERSGAVPSLRRPFEDLTCQVAKGEIKIIPSGSGGGKSTILT